MHSHFKQICKQFKREERKKCKRFIVVQKISAYVHSSSVSLEIHYLQAYGCLTTFTNTRTLLVFKSLPLLDLLQSLNVILSTKYNE